MQKVSAIKDRSSLRIIVDEERRSLGVMSFFKYQVCEHVVLAGRIEESGHPDLNDCMCRLRSPIKSDRLFLTTLLIQETIRVVNVFRPALFKIRS